MSYKSRSAKLDITHEEIRNIHHPHAYCENGKCKTKKNKKCDEVKNLAIESLLSKQIHLHEIAKHFFSKFNFNTEDDFEEVYYLIPISISKFITDYPDKQINQEIPATKLLYSRIMTEIRNYKCREITKMKRDAEQTALTPLYTTDSYDTDTVDYFTLLSQITSFLTKSHKFVSNYYISEQSVPSVRQIYSNCGSTPEQASISLMETKMLLESVVALTD
jgi:hypothetical protein